MVLCGDGCGTEVEQSSTGGRRKYCQSCRPSRDRSAPKMDKPAPVPRVEKAPSPQGGFEAETRSYLDAVGTLGTLEGALLVQIAREMDDCLESPSAFAALAGQYRQQLPSAMPAVSKSDDQADQLRRRREAKRRAAGE